MAKDKALEEIRRRLEDMGALRLQCKKLLEEPVFSLLNRDDPIWFNDIDEPELMQENLDVLRKDLVLCYKIICDMWDILSEGQ
jgi:hypothetical protein